MSQAFIDAVKKGDRDTVEQLLAKDPSVASSRDENGTSALLLCYYYGRP